MIAAKFQTSRRRNIIDRNVVRRGKGLRSARKNKLNRDAGVIIVLVSVFMLGVIGSMAAFSIDVITLYTARSEAQIAADAGALAGARVLANSGMTSDTTGALSIVAAEALARTVATQVAASNPVGGRTLNPGAANCNPNQEISVCFTHDTAPATDPQITVNVRRLDLPVFFARIMGTTQLAVKATAMAEAYNPSGPTGISSTNPPVSLTCVKPWLLPNITPVGQPGPASPIFDPQTGQILSSSLLGWESPNGVGTPGKLRSDCATGTTPGTCNTGNTPQYWQYYPATTDATIGDFPAPPASSVACCTGFNDYQLSVAGCVQASIACNQKVNIDTNADTTRDPETGAAVNGLTHSSSNGAGDSVENNPPSPPSGTAPFQFLAGSENPAVLAGTLASQSNIMVSNSLVTVPVFDSSVFPAGPPVFPQVQIIGFLQLFLNPNGDPARASGHIRTRVINIVGCGNNATGTPVTPIQGNGASPVAVRLISPTTP